MKFVCTKDTLLKAVFNVIRAISSKPQNPILGGILIKADSRISLTAFDNEFGINTVIDGDILRSGEIILDGKLFAEITRKMPEGYITVEKEGSNLVTISNGDTVFDITSMDAENYPELPLVTRVNCIKLKQSLLKYMIDKTAFAVSVNEINIILTGALMECENGRLTVVTVDGVRLALVSEAVDFDGSIRMIIPGKTLSEIAKIMTDDEDSTLEIYSDDKNALFVIDNYEIITRLMSGTFIDYKKTIPSDHKLEVIVQRSVFAECIDRASLLISESAKAPVRCNFKNGRIKVSCNTLMGKIEEEIPARLSAEGFEAGFNNRFLLDALKNADCDYIKLEMNSPQSPMKMTSAESGSFTYLVLPVRLVD